ncbi:MAG: hypothetical protein QOI69_332, partial [Pseudonocardiales bacterium]|nr:hypothetical protein [Pseudonocardiales bacterium]
FTAYAAALIDSHEAVRVETEVGTIRWC